MDEPTFVVGVGALAGSPRALRSSELEMLIGFPREFFKWYTEDLRRRAA